MHLRRTTRLLAPPLVVAAVAAVVATGGVDPAGAASKNHTVTVDDAQVAESGGALVFRLTRGKATGRRISVSYETAPGTATAGSDFRPVRGTVTFDSKASEVTIAVPVLNDGADEPDESVVLRLSSGGGGVTLARSSATGVIVDDDAAAPAGPDLRAEARADRTTVRRDEAAVFFVTIRNVGTAVAPGATIEMPGDPSNPSVSPQLIGIADHQGCDFVGTRTRCRVGDIGAGASRVVRVSYGTVSSPRSSPSRIEPVFTAAFAGTDPTPADNQTTAAVSVQNVFDLTSSIRPHGDPTPPPVGGTIDLDAVVQTGRNFDSARDVGLVLRATPGLELVSADARCTRASAQELRCVLPTVTTSTTVGFTARIVSAGGGTVTADVTRGPADAEVEPANDDSSYTVA